MVALSKTKVVKIDSFKTLYYKSFNPGGQVHFVTILFIAAVLTKTGKRSSKAVGKAAKWKSV